MRPMLIVGNDQLRKRFVAILSQTVYQVVEAETGETAIDLARSLLPQFVLMEILLPQLNGLETAARLRTLSELDAVSIILLGSIPPIGLNEEPLVSIVDGYLSTDASPAEVLQCINKCAIN